jgi:uncharacterized membrane protein YphA (DoxX/SURF4 family)
MASGPVRESWIRAGRFAFGISLPVFGILHFVYPANVAALVQTASVPLPWPMFWAYLTGAGHIAAGVAIASGILARWGAVLAGIMYAPWVVTLHLHRVLDHPPGYQGDRPELTSCSCAPPSGAPPGSLPPAWAVHPLTRRPVR